MASLQPNSTVSKHLKTKINNPPSNFLNFKTKEISLNTSPKSITQSEFYKLKMIHNKYLDSHTFKNEGQISPIETNNKFFSF